MLNHKVSKAVRLAIAFGAASSAAFTSTAFAAEDGAKKVERIEVTGSRIKRTDMEGAMPVSSFSLEDIKATGVPTLEQFVEQLPIISGGSYGSSTNNGGTGFVSMNLRGLGDDRTLVLLNGRRFSGDISVIPMAAIARVDVLRDGASTIYGSDAIAGVVNFITTKDYSGTEIEFRYQETSEGDGETDSISFVTGVEGDKGNLILSVGYDKREAIYGSQRDFSSCPYFERDTNDDGVNDETFCAGSSRTTPSSFSLSDGTRGTFMKADDGSARPLTAEDRYNYASSSILYQPRESYNIFAAGRYELLDSDFTTVEFFSENMFTHRTSEQQMAPTATFWGMTVPESHPDNTMGQDVSATRRLTETGGRNWQRDVYEYLITSGFQGELDNGWFWDVSYGVNHRRQNIEEDGRVHQERITNLVNKETCAADELCSAAVAGTPNGVWNPFEKDTLTKAMQDYVIVPLTNTTISEDTQLQFNLTGDSGDFELPAGAVAWAVGYEHLSTSYRNIKDGAAGLGQIYGVAAGGAEGKYNTEAAYVEVNIPLLADLPFAERLDLTVATRRTDVSTIEDAETTSKVALEWRPNSELLVRANYSEGFRTPGIVDMFRPRTQSANTYSDPCVDFATSESATLRANCLADGLPLDWEQTNRQSGSWIGGSPDLGPEKSESVSLGVVWSPEFIEGFSMTLDYYDIAIEEVIGELGIGTIAAECYNSENFSSPMCAQIKGPQAYGASGNGPRRDSTDSLSGVDLATQNLGFFDSEGVDFDFEYKLAALSGDIRFKLSGTYLLDHTHLEAEGLTASDLLGKYGNDVANGGRGAFNKVRANFRTSYSQDDWGLSHTIQYQSAVDDFAPADSNLSNSVDAMMYHDVSGYYHAHDNLSLSFGITNLLDQDPEYVTNGDNRMLIRVHRLTGRQYFAKATFKF
ncbi:TonB-dependent receptor plug domain-containing protein [Pseudoalteromonas aurantia]|uniref:TonB-dependent receptor n=1 Tax=Pseudoalteromonas aurantia TaxID=43654 RepID=A0A5S3VAM4_9GAMM|nr:TonB-dependent receptor [Pseudoalteromonas aurantia]TMO68977.1 TonB-dependent receptor [Pseudoalteromonas aurantia]TMO71832.1 TonB-dependent receptor [Pseudoalteromonas aurantia]